MSRIYAGIGARKTPPDVLEVMTALASKMEEEEWKLRSGGAAGADSAFEAGVINPANKAIYLPGNTFNQRSAQMPGMHDSTRLSGWQQALETVAQYHPAPERLTPFAKSLMARNAMQMMGPRMQKPADLVVAYTPGGEVTGGTGQALRMAGNLGIPVRNLGDPTVLAAARRYLATAPQLNRGTFEIVASRGPQADYDVLGMRARGKTMATVQAPGEPGWLGNPYVADDAGGAYTRQQATDMFRALVEEKSKDPAWRDAFLGLAGKKVGYYKPSEPAIHLHAVQDWIAKNS